MSPDPASRAYDAGLSPAAPLRIALVAPPVERVPPPGYGGTERIVDELGRELARRGHAVTLFASADSESPGELFATTELPLRAIDHRGDPGPWLVATVLAVLREQRRFDVIHSHLDFHGLTLARAAATPVAATFHGRLDLPVAPLAFADAPRGLVALSRSHAASRPEVRWEGVVHNGMRYPPYRASPTDGSLCFVGRIIPEKGILDAIEVARLTGRCLRVAAKRPHLQSEREYYRAVFLPAARRADVELLGELDATDRDDLLRGSDAAILPAAWPEPFGLTALESMAVGTPVIGRPVGAVPEIVRHGIDGFLDPTVDGMAAAVGRLGELDRHAIAGSVRERFSVERMTDGYEAVYGRILAPREGPAAD